MELAELEKQARAYRELQRMAEEVAAEQEAVKAALRAELAARGVEVLDVGAFRVSDRTVRSARVDVAALRRELPEVAQRYTLSAETRRFCVT